jgi:protein-tyrosine-phosphatase
VLLYCLLRNGSEWVTRFSNTRRALIKMMMERQRLVRGRKSVDEFADQQFDYVFSVCDNAKEAFPIFPGGGRRLHQSFEDPAGPPTDHQTRSLP